MIKMNRIFAAACAAVLTAGAFLPLSAAGRSSYQEILTRSRNTPDQRIAYGKDALQFGDLYLPSGAGSHPVVVLIHGGCWLGELPGLELMDQMAGDLKAHGFAVWSIEYRRLGQAGGGYPGTFQDAANGIDKLRDFAARYRLDLSHVVLVGHSAGGHLAVWAAARAHLPASSVLHSARPLSVHGVVSLSGILDLQSYGMRDGEACGGAETVDALVGRPARTQAYDDTSPAMLVPIGVPQTIISGSEDSIVAPRFAHAYAAKAKAAGDKVQDMEIAGAGHFEMIDPKSAAWPAIEAAIEKMSK